MIKDEFWEDWYYDDDLAQWVKDDEEYDFEWRSAISIEELTQAFKVEFQHNADKEKLIKCAWDKINCLPVHTDERGKQDWTHTGNLINNDNVDRITTIFYEANFDIYRETHLEFEKIGDDYKYVNLTHEII